MPMNPVLVELTRGPLIESVHRGALAVADADGRLLLSVGDVYHPVFPRSAIKAFQALPLIETGAADRFGFGESELALAAASHAGTGAHVDIAAGMLRKAGLSREALECGAHEPLGAAARRELAITGAQPTALHNNCSGKHAGMLATAAHLGEHTSGYIAPDHPVQVRVRRAIEDLAAMRIGRELTGIDGCSLPNFALPLARMARAFAAFATGTAGASSHREAAARIMRACWARPELVAGPGRLDTEVMRACPGHVFLKTGAEGVYGAGLPDRGLGIAVKIDDGAKRAAELVIMHTIARLLPPAAQLLPTSEQVNWRGIVTGEIRPATTLASAWDKLDLCE
jgi:L-asparaginase II